MKAKSFLFSMLAAATLVGCSSDDVMEEVGGGQVSADATTYIAVSLKSPGDLVSRASYAEGYESERKVNKADFLFFDANKRCVAVVSKTFDKQTPQQGNISDVTPVQVLLEKTELKPTRMLTLVNYKGDAKLFKAKQLDFVRKSTLVDNYAEANNFFMSTSSYVQGDYGTNIEGKLFEIKQGNKPTDEEAQKNAVDVYVERAAVKVKTTFPTQTPTISSVIVDGEPQTVTVSLEKWGLTATNKDSYLFKDIEYGQLNWSSEAPNDFRTYWAMDNDYASGRYAQQYSDGLKKVDGVIDYNSSFDPDLFDLNYPSQNELTKADSLYCLENTSSEALVNGNKNPYTTVLAVAQIKVGNKEAETLFKLAGAYYTKSSFENVALNLLQSENYKIRRGTSSADYTYEDLKATDLKLVPAHNANNNEVYFDLTNVEEVYFTGTDAQKMTPVKVSDIQTKLKGWTKASQFTEGYCSYIIPLKHIGSADPGKYGVVRNHFYHLTINNIFNIGDAVYDPNAPIIPTPQDKPVEFYLSAKLNVLSWKTVNQNVDL